MSRVFNVSHHKCATTSVHHALEILGFRSFHWHNPDHLLHVHLEGRVATDKALLEDNTAWSDLPITLMYRSLYEAFPNETYIFVYREPRSWLESLRKHIKNSWKEALPIHTLVYGYPIRASNFDPDVCLRTYERICSDICKFSAGKKNFHLLDFEALSWPALCAAVGKPEPLIPFPWLNKGS